MRILRSQYVTAPQPSLTQFPVPNPEVMAYSKKRCQEIMRQVQATRDVVNTMSGDKADKIASMMNEALQQRGLPPESHQVLREAAILGMALSWLDHGDRSFRQGLMEEHFHVVYALGCAAVPGSYGSYAYAAGYPITNPGASPETIAAHFGSELDATGD